MEPIIPAPLTETIVLEALKDVYDPEIPVNVVDLGLIYQVKIIDDWVGVKMTLTSPGCGLADQIADQVRHRILDIPGVVNGDVRIVWQPQWNPGMITPEARKKLMFMSGPGTASTEGPA
ncbi:MAG: metal-sulfur cluster assembly factor [Bacteroidetes bacterium]|jgi:metal-sulfur cluster biosynthetic enzyme|nr:metal-sulfur cluster assembly factor [Bacteroidota bacterium]